LLYPPPFYLRFSENSALRFRKKPQIWNDNSRSTTDQKNLKISQCYVTMTYNTQYFFIKIGEVPRQKKLKYHGMAHWAFEKEL
jgi:hypothetical protein